MSCNKVPVKLAGFNSITTPCCNGLIVSNVTLGGLDASSVNTAPAHFTTGVDVSNIAYLAVKCVKIACAPVVVLQDNVNSLVAFLDANLTGFTPVGTENSTSFTNITLAKYGLANAIGGCDSCCACSS